MTLIVSDDHERADGGRRRPDAARRPIPTIPAGAAGALPARTRSRRLPAGCCSSPTVRAARSAACSRPRAHMNMGGSLHGGAVLSFIDMAMFAGGAVRGDGARPLRDARPRHPFPRARPAGLPLDAHVELLKRDPRPCLPARLVRQEGEPCYSFTGTLKRIRERNAPPHDGRSAPRYDALRRRRRAEARPRPGARGRRRSTGSRRARELPGAFLSRLAGRGSRTARRASISGAASGAASRC